MDENIRAVALYRASSKGQTDRENNNDIPTQKKIVQNYIYQQGWSIVREFTEGGVSGFTVSEKDRDALQTIKTMAIKNEFDVLVVYMSDRIGRLKDETPLVIKFLYDHKVRVFSASEGEIKNETHTDSLLTYIRYWQAEGESRKTSTRVSDYLIEAVKEGRFRGGNCIPLGYMLVDNGSKNFKGRKIKDFVINPDEVPIAKLIFYLSAKMNYGQRRIALHLNEHGYKTREGYPWKSASIQHILANPIYKGQFKIHSKMYDKDVYSPILENLIIIPEHEWEENRKIVESRTYKKKDENYENTRNTHGKLLLSGIIYCGHCGEKLTTFLETKRYKRKDGEITTSYSYRYRCMSFYKRGAVNCEGQSAYGAKKINAIVTDEVKAFIMSLQEKNLNEEFLKTKNKELKELTNNKSKRQDELAQLYKELKALKDEVVNVLMGTSKFNADMLNELISQKENTIKNENSTISKIEKNITEMTSDIFVYKSLDKDLVDWSKRFDEADDYMKKAMVLSVVDRIKVFRDEVEITFNVKIETYKENSSLREVQNHSIS